MNVLYNVYYTSSSIKMHNNPQNVSVKTRFTHNFMKIYCVYLNNAVAWGVL